MQRPEPGMWIRAKKGSKGGSRASWPDSPLGGDRRKRVSRGNLFHVNKWFKVHMGNQVRARAVSLSTRRFVTA